MPCEKRFCFFLFFLLFWRGSAQADTLGFRAGFYLDSPDLLSDERDYFITPRLEYGRSFQNFDLHFLGEYSFHLFEFLPQFFFAEETFAARLPLGSRADLQFRIRNENEVLIDPDGDNGRVVGAVKPELGGGLFPAAGDFSLNMGFPLGYGSRPAEDFFFGLDPMAAYASPFGVGIEVIFNFLVAPSPAFDGMELALKYTHDQFYGRIAFKARESFDFFSLKAEIDYFFDFFILNIALEWGNLSVRDAMTLAPAIGIEYRF
jgi:hypothetical protein